MRLRSTRSALLLVPLAVLAACASGSGLDRSTQDLNERLRSRLAADLAAGRATLQPIPHGAVVTLSDQSAFAPGGAELSEAGRSAVTSVIQSLLAPRILRIDVAESAANPSGLQAARVQTVMQSFERAGVGQSMQAAGQTQGGTGSAPGSAGLTISIHVIAS